VVIAIIAILAAILFPVFSQVREKARATACLSNTKQLGHALTQYYQDWDERLVLNGIALGYQYGQWADFLQPYIKNDQLLLCPGSQRNSSHPYDRWITGQGRQCSYTVNNVTGTTIFLVGSLSKEGLVLHLLPKLKTPSAQFSALMVETQKQLAALMALNVLT